VKRENGPLASYTVEADRYTLTAAKEGYETFEDNDLILEEGTVVELEIMLAPSDGVGYDFLEINKPYVSSDNGLTVEVTSLAKVNKTEHMEYHLNYTETNNTKETIDQGAFKLFFTDGPLRSGVNSPDLFYFALYRILNR
jgi:hypothetical protein